MFHGQTNEVHPGTLNFQYLQAAQLTKADKPLTPVVAYNQNSELLHRGINISTKFKQEL